MREFRKLKEFNCIVFNTRRQWIAFPLNIKQSIGDIQLSLDLNVCKTLETIENISLVSGQIAESTNTTAPYRSYRWQDRIVEGGQAAYCTSYNQKLLQTSSLWRQNNAFSRKHSSMFEDLYSEQDFTLYERTKWLTC